jgi:lipopolysaccharide biosynthesis glycosyltransferase
MQAYYFVVNETLAEFATAQAVRINRLTGTDIHIFIEGRCEGTRFKAFDSPSIHYHYDRLSKCLPPGVPVSKRFPGIVYLRIFAPRLLTHYRRLVYLDADVFFLRPDDAIWEVDLPHGVGAVHDMHMIGDLTPQRDKPKDEWLADLGIRSARYFNTGVLVIDPLKWGEIDFESRLSDFVSDYRQHIRFMDQDFLNHHFQSRWTELSPRFNFQYQMLGRGYALSLRPSLVHFNAPDRPWLNGWMSHHMAVGRTFRKLYESALRDAGYSIEKYYRPRSPWFTFRRLPAHCRRIVSKLGVPRPFFPFAMRGWNNQREQIRRYFDEAFANGRFADLSGGLRAEELPLRHTGYRFKVDESDYWGQFLADQKGKPSSGRG